MKELTLLFTIILMCESSSLRPHTVSSKCKPVHTVADFKLDEFVDGRWYIHQQQPTAYLPESQNFCVTAEYAVFPKPTFWGYTIQVHNHAEESDGKIHDSGKSICAAETDPSDAAKLEVAPCDLPKVAAGPYWVLEYNETEGYALISGGQPKIPTEGGLCTTGSGVNNSGLWIFTRSSVRDENLVKEVRRLAVAQGIDVSGLKDVDQTNCDNGAWERLNEA